MKSFKVFFRSLTVAGLLFMMILIPLSSAAAYSEGPKNPAAGASLPGAGETWLNPGQITTPGSPYATVALYQGHRTSNYLQGSQYGFAIPADVEIFGIEVKISHMSVSPNPDMTDAVVSLVKGGSIVGDNKANLSSSWPTVLTVATYGGPTDLWGTAWTPAEINAADFGAVVAAYRVNNGTNLRDAAVDSIQITVYYGYSTTSSVVCGDGSPVMYGDNVVCVATVTRSAGSLTPGGPVAWTSDGSGTFDPNPCTLAGADGIATCSATYTPRAVGSGSHTITATYNGDSLFSGSNASQAVTVVTRPISVAADPQSKVYGQPDPALTYQITEGSLVFTETFTGSLTREAGENVGQYDILQGSLALTASYSMTFISNTLTITPADPTCVVTPYSLTYDGSEHIATGSCTGVFGEDLPGLDLSLTAHTNAGSYMDPWAYTDQTGNYTDTSGTVDDVIAMADATCDVTPYDMTYDGTAHTAEGACTGVLGEPLAGLDLSGTTHTDAGNYTDPWTFTDENGNYNGQSGEVVDNIAQAEATCQVTPYDVTYDGSAHTAEGACTGVLGEPLEGLDLSATAHTDAGSYLADPWIFTDPTGNYLGQNGVVDDNINKANATCDILPYDVTYDGNTHTASGACLGVDGLPLEGLDLSLTNHLSAGTYTDPWTFTDQTGNYNDANGSLVDTISKAEPACEVTPYDVTYDGLVHTATGSCTGIGGEPLEGLNLDATVHTDAGNYTDAWTFTDETGNYNDASGPLLDVIGKAAATCEVTGYTVEYDAAAHIASGACIGVLGEPLEGLDLSGTTHTVVGVYAGDPWTFSDASGNYTDSSGTVDDEITKRAITVVADNKSKPFGQPDPALTFQVTSGSLLAGDAFTGSLERVPGEHTGTYQILQGSLALPDYYEITFVEGTFTITGGRILLPLIVK